MWHNSYQFDESCAFFMGIRKKCVYEDPTAKIKGREREKGRNLEEK